MINIKAIRVSLIFFICILLGFGSTGFGELKEYKVNSVSKLNAVVKEQLLKSCSDFVIIYEGKSKTPRELYDNSFTNALKNDYYLRWNIISASADLKVKDNILTIRYKTVFLSSEEEEKKVDDLIDEVIKGIIKPEMSQIQKAKAINNYITSKVSYDKTYAKRSAYSALFENKSVCQGYTLLAQKLFTKANLESIIVDGYLKNEGHVWNKVKLDGIWYNIDTTNNDENFNIYFAVSDDFLLSHNFKFDVTKFPPSNVSVSPWATGFPSDIRDMLISYLDMILIALAVLVSIISLTIISIQRKSKNNLQPEALPREEADIEDMWGKEYWNDYEIQDEDQFENEYDDEHNNLK